MSKSKVTDESVPSSSSSHRSTFDLPQCGKSIKRIRRSSSESSSSSESHSKDDHIQQRKINNRKQNESQSKQTPNSPPIQSTPIVPLHIAGSYILPTKLRLLHIPLTNKSTIEYQRLAWKALKKTINDPVNKLNISNLSIVIREIFQNNIVRGRGLLARAIIRSQIVSPCHTSVYAALVSVINSKFPQIGELIIKRLMSSFCRAYVNPDKKNCLATTKFLAHLVNQNTLHEISGIDILSFLLEDTYLSNDKVELGIEFLKECGQKLSEVIPRGLDSVLSRFRYVIRNLSLNQRTQSMIEVVLAARKDEFKAYPSIPTGLDLVNENHQYTHMITLDRYFNPEPEPEPELMLNVFQYDDQYEKNERKYKQIRKRILDETSDDEYESSGNSLSSDDEDDQKKTDVNEEEQTFNDEEKEKEEIIIDQTEINLVTLRERICLIIELEVRTDERANELLQINLPPGLEVRADERANELLQINLTPGLEIEVCQIILDICAQERTYRNTCAEMAKFCCSSRKEYRQCFEKMFRDQYETVHHLESFKVRNVAKFFAHLLATDAISWKVLDCVRLTIKETTSLSRLFLKNLFFRLFEVFGSTKLNRRLNDPTLTVYVRGLFHHDTEKNTNFAINFFTSIGLGELTDGMRKYMKRKRQPSPHLQVQEKAKKKKCK